jgi:hypothetical protein
MVTLIPIRYRNKKYPDEIEPKIEEISAHFDSKITVSDLDCSLHTEYSYGPRKFTCLACKDLSGIRVTDGKGVPKLWFNEDWVRDFTQFTLEFVDDRIIPTIIEIHPPFDDYCNNLSQFIELYQYFEDEIMSTYPKIEVLIENRYGSQYSDGTFIFSTIDDLKELTKLIKEHDLKLRIALDFPQLFSAHGFDIGKFSKNELSEIFKQLYSVRRYIASIHLWGKCIGKNNRASAHMGTLDSYFKGLRCTDIDKIVVPNSYTETVVSSYDDIKRYFLRELYNLLNDGRVRYFLPEVNSRADHLKSIVRDLINSGFKFI